MKDDKLSNMFSLMELLCRPQGCSVREAMKELHCASRTFYRTLNTFDELHIPYDKKPDFDGPTNSQRYCSHCQGIASFCNGFVKGSNSIKRRIN